MVGVQYVGPSTWLRVSASDSRPGYPIPRGFTAELSSPYTPASNSANGPRAIHILVLMVQNGERGGAAGEAAGETGDLMAG